MMDHSQLFFYYLDRPADMNETAGYVRIDNETGSKTYPSARSFFEIVQYLSERDLQFYSMTKGV